jgi:hypothetical protein
MAAANPKRKRGGGSHRRRARRNPAVAVNRKRSGNRFMGNRHHRRRRNNPNIIGTVKGAVMNGIYAIAGGVMTRSLPQAVLGDKNTGIMGYAANFIAAFGGGALIGRVAGPQAGAMWAIGGSVMIVGRAFEDFVGRQFVSFQNVDLPIPQLMGRLGSDRAFNFRRRRMAGDFVPLNTPVPYNSLPLPALTAAPALAGTWSRAWN